MLHNKSALSICQLKALIVMQQNVKNSSAATSHDSWNSWKQTRRNSKSKADLWKYEQGRRRRTSNHNDSVRSCKRSMKYELNTGRYSKVFLSLKFSRHEVSLQHTLVQVGQWGSAQVGCGCKTLPQPAWRQVGRALALLWRWFIPGVALLNSMPLYW